MADKNKLDDLLTQDFVRPPIRGGQGVTLSTQAVPDEPVASPRAGEAPAQPESAAEPDTPIDAQSHNRTRRSARDAAPRSTELTNAPTHDRINEHASLGDKTVERVSQGQRLRVDLLRALKQIALDDGRKLYQVMEDAIEDYIERRRQHDQ